jgi:glycine/serine hydroxymethyltransferase
MKDTHDMSAPVTRGELQEAIARLATKVELREAIAPLATKVELHEAIAKAVAPLATKVELHEAIAKAVAPLATKVELEIWGGALMSRMDAQLEALRRDLQSDFARHANTIFEAAQAMIRAIDDKYTDLPGRVGTLESRLIDVESR